MKKYLSTIFILVVTAGIFVSTVHIHADPDPNQQFCFDSSGALYNVGISQDECRKLGYNWGTTAQYLRSSTPHTSVTKSLLPGEFDLVGTVLFPLGVALVKLTSWVTALAAVSLN